MKQTLTLTTILLLLSSCSKNVSDIEDTRSTQDTIEQAGLSIKFDTSEEDSILIDDEDVDLL